MEFVTVPEYAGSLSVTDTVGGMNVSSICNVIDGGLAVIVGAVVSIISTVTVTVSGILPATSAVAEYVMVNTSMLLVSTGLGAVEFVIVPTYAGSLSVTDTVGGVNVSSISSVIVVGFAVMIGKVVSVMQVLVAESSI